jgi:hypothetical protein
MELLNTLTDDQLALIGSVLALIVCGSMMSLSFHLGRFLRRSRAQARAERQILEPHTAPTHSGAASDRDSRGKAA